MLPAWSTMTIASGTESSREKSTSPRCGLGLRLRTPAPGAGGRTPAPTPRLPDLGLGGPRRARGGDRARLGLEVVDRLEPDVPVALELQRHARQRGEELR